MKNLRKNIIALACTALSLCGLASSCNKYDTPVSVAGGDERTDTTLITKAVRCVLWVNIDGAVGSLVKQEAEQGNLPTLQGMLEHSKYAWTGLSDSRSKTDGSTEMTEEDPLTWASMLTGVSSNLHFIKDYSYSPDFEIGDDPVGQVVSYFPTLVQYLTKADASLSISCVTPWRNLNRYVGDATSTTTTATDEETQEELLKQLQENDYRFMLTSFRGVLDAGKKDGFSLNNAGYDSALKTVDGYLKDLLAAIEARPDAYNEDWLVLVTSNHGGTPDGHCGGASDAERDIFGLFYYPHYTTFQMKGELMDAARFSSTEWALAADSTALYGIGPQRNFSFEMNIRMTPRSDGSYTGKNWSCLVGKDEWGMFRQRTGVSIRATNEDAGTDVEGKITACNDAVWHSFYMGLGTSDGSTRKYLMSYDGMRQKYEDTECMGTSDDSTSVVVGKGSIWGNDLIPNSYYVASLRLWNEILDDATVESNASLLSISEGHKYRRNLIGEWRFSPDELVNDTVIPNRIKGMPDMIFNGKPTFVKQANTLPAQLKSGNLVMENTLIAPQIMYWLCGKSSIDSRLEGYNFLSAYSLEEQWRDYEEGTETNKP